MRWYSMLQCSRLDNNHGGRDIISVLCGKNALVSLIVRVLLLLLLRREYTSCMLIDNLSILYSIL